MKFSTFLNAKSLFVALELCKCQMTSEISLYSFPFNNVRLKSDIYAFEDDSSHT